MRNWRSWVVGSISIVCFAFPTSAWGAPDDTEGRPPPDAPSPVEPTATPAPPPATGATPEAPKPLTGPVTDPLPSDGSGPLPPLPPSAPMLYDAPPPPPTGARRSEWGAQFRLEAAGMGGGASPDAGMGGIGFSLRPRPNPYFAIDFGVDFMGGRDFNGDRRSESAFSVNPMVFLNPRSKVQIYLFAGLGVGGARVEPSHGPQREYRYVGADAGAGLEFRFWRHFALSGDVLAFVRDRTDVDGTAPEYIDTATGRYTDSSAGALFRLGGTYYW